MSSLTRVNYVAQQRLDLQHLLAAESYTAFDFRALITAFTGDKPFVLRGFQVTSKTGLAITVNVQDSLTFNPLDGNGSFYKGLSDDDNVIIELPAQQENLFVEAKFINVTKNPVNTAQWDPLALTGEDVAGTEFSASINSQVLMQLVISANSVGFSDGAIPILRASTDGSNVTNMIDCRPMLYRLGSGGVSPNPANKFSWGTKRREPVPSGTGVGDDISSPFMSKDLTGALNDKALGTFKEWADAVMTRICEVSGSSLWYSSDVAPNDPTHGYITGIDLQRLALDSESGHSVQPSDTVTIKWVRQDPTLPINESTNPLLLTAEGPDGVDDISVMSWQANYGPVSWELGGEFINNAPGGNRRYKTRPYTTPNRIFESPYIVNSGNLYLILERDVVPPLASGNAVKWANSSAFPAAPDATKVISGVTGDFTGIAIGDWVRKSSEGFSQYYRVTMFSNGLNTVGDIADSSVVAIVVEQTIATGSSVEEMMYFRSRYAATDLFGDDVIGQYDARDSNYYWLGRRVDNVFIFRGYGNLQEGEEAYVQDDSSMAAATSEPFILKHANDAVYSVLSGYSIRVGTPAIKLITIKKRKRDNLIYTGSGSDNTDGFLEYYINAPVGLMSDGDGLWVRLNDTTGGVLTNGSVVIDDDDFQNLDIITNRWEVRSMANNPLRNFDNKDVHLIARRIVLADGLTPALQFVDGTIIDAFGLVVDHYRHFNKDLRTKADVYLGTKTPKSVLFIDQTPAPLDGDSTVGNGRIDEDNASFNYDKDNQELTLFNNVFGWNYHNIITPEDQQWFQGMGDHTLTIADSNSTVFIPGNLTVQGSQTIIGTSNVITSDKNMTLGVGNLLYGGGGSGIQIADNTLKILSVSTYIGQIYMDITPETDPSYALDQLVGIVSTQELDDITAAEQSNVYKMVAVGSVAGDIQSLGSGMYRIWTRGTASASGSYTYTTITSPIQAFDILSEIHLSNSDTTTGGMTSWSFGVKRNPNLVNNDNEGTVHAVVTPYESSASAQDFLTIPTSRQSNFTRKRIPYAWKDGVGPSGSDTTFDFTDRLTWDYDTYTFRIHGTLQLKGNFVPEDDNTWDLGTTALRWKTLHVGPGSVVVHNDNTNTNWVNLSYTGALAQITTDSNSNLLLRSASLNQFKLFTDKRGSFGLAYSGSGDATAIFEFGNDTINVLASAMQFGIKVDQRLAGSNESHLLHLAGVAAYSGAMAAWAELHIAGVTVATGSLTTQYGMLIDDLSAGTNKYGIYSNLSKVTNKWFIYGNGLADSYFGGNVGIGNNTQGTIDNYRLVIGTTSDSTTAGGILIGGDVEVFRSATNTLKTNDNLIVALTSKLTQQTVIGTGSQNTNAFLTLNGILPDTSAEIVGIDSYFTSGTTHVTKITSFLSRPITANFGVSTTITDVMGYRASNPTLGTNATITNISDIYLDDITVAATLRAGVNSMLTRATGKWDLYMQGGASSYFSGSVGIGNNTQATVESFRLLIGLNTDTTSVGGLSFGGDTYLYRAATDTIKTSGYFTVDKTVYIGYDVDFASYSGVNIPVLPASTRIKTFAKGGQIWQMTSDGTITLLTNYQGDIFEEIVDVVSVPSGNNQMAPIVAGSTTINLPLDTKYLIGTSIVAVTTASGSKVIRVFKLNHGFTGGETVNIIMTQSLDGIIAGQMTGSFVVTYESADTFLFTASAGNNAAVGGVTGYLDRVYTTRIRYYIVGQGELELYLNGVMQRKGLHWAESGSTNTLSRQVIIYRDLVVGDYVTWRISANGGQTAISTFSDSTKRLVYSAMVNGSGLSLSMGTPVRHSLTGLQKVDITLVSCEGIAGLVFDTSIGVGLSGTVIASGLLEGGGTGFSDGDILYVSSTGTLTNVRPSVSGQYIIVVGVVKNNPVTLAKDLMVGVRIIKQLP